MNRRSQKSRVVPLPHPHRPICRQVKPVPRLMDRFYAVGMPGFVAGVSVSDSVRPRCSFTGRSCELRPQSVSARKARDVRRAPVRAVTDPGPVLVVGDVVAVSRGGGVSGTLELGVVTGTDSSGRNVDFQPLEAFVPELYVHSSDPTTFVRSNKVRKVPSTYVPAQNGWIVLNADVAEADRFFSSSLELPSVSVVEAPPRQLSEDALRRQGFLRPTRTQAFVGAALSIPISALAYSVFAAERTAFSGGGTPGALEDVALVGAASIAVLSIIVGCALFLYAVYNPEKAE